MEDFGTRCDWSLTVWIQCRSLILFSFSFHLFLTWCRYFGLLFPNRFRCCPFKCYLILPSSFMNGCCCRRCRCRRFSRLLLFFYFIRHFMFATIKGLHSNFRLDFITLNTRIERKQNPSHIFSLWIPLWEIVFNHKNDWWQLLRKLLSVEMLSVSGRKFWGVKTVREHLWMN